MKQYYYHFIDDVIWAFRDLTREKPSSLFDNPFFGMLKEANEKYGVKTQLNLFYRTDYAYGMDEFCLSEVPDTYKKEFEEASEWLKMTFHARQEFPDYPHVNASYDDVYKLFEMTKKEIVRFAGEKSVAYGVVPHWRPISFEGCKALYDCGVKITSATVGIRKEYNGDPSSLPYGHAVRLLINRKPETMTFVRNSKDTAIAQSICGYNHIDDVSLDDGAKNLRYLKDEKTGLCLKNLCNGLFLNLFSDEELQKELKTKLNDELVAVGNHEQYFYKDYFNYQSEYAKKILTLGRMMKEAGIEPIFIEDVISLNG